MFLNVQGRLEVGISGKIENIFDKIITKYVYQKVLKKIICAQKKKIILNIIRKDVGTKARRKHSINDY